MTTFIKLTNGTTINRDSIRTLEKEAHCTTPQKLDTLAGLVK